MITDTITIRTGQDMVQLECHSLSQQDIFREIPIIKFQEDIDQINSQETLEIDSLTDFMEGATALDPILDMVMVLVEISTEDSPGLSSHNKGQTILHQEGSHHLAVAKASIRDNLASINPRIPVLVNYPATHQLTPVLITFLEDSSSPRVKRTQAPVSPVFSFLVEIEDNLVTNSQVRIAHPLTRDLEDSANQTVKME